MTDICREYMFYEMKVDGIYYEHMPWIHILRRKVDGIYDEYISWIHVVLKESV